MAQNGNVDAKQYYGYLFEADKKPTKVLDALLRGIAIFIVSCDEASRQCAIKRNIEADLAVAEFVDRKYRAEEAHARQASTLLQGCGRQLRLLVSQTSPSHSSTQLMMPCYSSLRRGPSSIHLVDLRINRLPTHPTTDCRRLRASLDPCPHKERLRTLAVHRDIARTRRTRPLHPNRRSHLQHQAP